MTKNLNSKITKLLLEEHFTLADVGGGCLALRYTFLGPIVPGHPHNTPCLLVTHADGPRLPADEEECTIGYYEPGSDGPTLSYDVMAEECLYEVRRKIGDLYNGWFMASARSRNNNINYNVAAISPPQLPPVLRPVAPNRHHRDVLAKLLWSARKRREPDQGVVDALMAAIESLFAADTATAALGAAPAPDSVRVLPPAAPDMDRLYCSVLDDARGVTIQLISSIPDYTTETAHVPAELRCHAILDVPKRRPATIVGHVTGNKGVVER